MATKQSTGFVRLKEGTNWTDPHKKAKKEAATSRGIKTRGGKPMAGAPKAGAKARGGKPMAGTAKAAPVAKTAPKKMAPAKAKAAPKAASKTSSYGNDSYAQHESFRKELEAGGVRATWNASKQAEAGGAKVEISKPSSGTSLNAELDKFQASGGKSAKKDVKLGVVGRTGGKWHLGKKAGKG